MYSTKINYESLLGKHYAGKLQCPLFEMHFCCYWKTGSFCCCCKIRNLRVTAQKASKAYRCRATAHKQYWHKQWLPPLCSYASPGFQHGLSAGARGLMTRRHPWSANSIGFQRGLGWVQGCGVLGDALKRPVAVSCTKRYNHVLQSF